MSHGRMRLRHVNGQEREAQRVALEAAPRQEMQSGETEEYDRGRSQRGRSAFNGQAT